MRVIIEIDQALTPPQVSIVKAGTSAKARSLPLALAAVEGTTETDLAAPEDAGAAPGYAGRVARAAEALEAEAAPPEPTSAGAAPKK
jgi:hypothetical protein